jgi:hypothetical protein
MSRFKPGKAKGLQLQAFVVFGPGNLGRRNPDRHAQTRYSLERLHGFRDEHRIEHWRLACIHHVARSDRLPTSMRLLSNVAAVICHLFAEWRDLQPRTQSLASAPSPIPPRRSDPCLRR